MRHTQWVHCKLLPCLSVAESQSLNTCIEYHVLMCWGVLEELQQPMASPVYGLGGGVHPVVSSSIVQYAQCSCWYKSVCNLW